MNLEQWLAKGQQLQNTLDEANMTAINTRGEYGRWLSGTTYNKKLIGENLLNRASFKQVRGGKPAAEVLKQIKANGEQVNSATTELLHKTERLYEAETNLKQAANDVEAAEKAIEDIEAQLEQHTKSLPADAVHQVAECRAEVKKLESEFSKLDAVFSRVEEHPKEDAATIQKLLEAEANYSNALADTELEPDNKKLASQAEKLRSVLEEARCNANRPAEDRQHKLDALSKRRDIISTRLEELDAIIRRAISATHAPRLSQSRAAIKAAIQKHLMPAIGKHNALVQLLDNHAPAGIGYSYEQVKLDLISKMLKAVGADEEGQEWHSKAVNSELDKLFQAMDTTA